MIFRKCLVICVLLYSMTHLAWSQSQDKSNEHAAHDMHAGHRSAIQASHYSVATENYVIPDVELIDQYNVVTSLPLLLKADRAVALNFIFTTCTTICPVMTATFAQMRRELGEASDEVTFVSISIDPEYDRPQILKEYAQKFDAGTGWTFLTGDGGDISNVLRSFDAYAGSKMNHQPLTLLKSSGGSSWTRIEGLASGKELANEMRVRLLN